MRIDYDKTLEDKEKPKEVSQTSWQKRLNDEPDFDKRKMIVFEFMDSIGMDTSDWKERKEIEKRRANKDDN